MRFLFQFISGLLLLAVGALILMHFMPGSATLARSIGMPEGMIELVARETPDAKGPEGQAGSGRGRGNGPQAVVVEAAVEGKVNDRLRAIGDGDAIHSVSVTPLVSGQVAKVFVKAGQTVKTGDVLVRLDDDVEKIAVSRARVALEAAENTLNRNRDLKKIVSTADLEGAESAVETARLALSEAELNLARRDVKAPFTGVAGIVSVTTGDSVTASSAIVGVDDRSKLLVDFWVPERFVGLLKEGQGVEAKPIARPGKMYPGKVLAIDNRIDAASRTLHVRAEILNQGDELRAGQSFEVTMNIGGDSWPAVNPLSIQWDSEGAFVWRLNERKVERVAVTIIERGPDKVLVDAAIKPGDMIVTEGLQRLRNGAEVRIFGEKPMAEMGSTEKETKS